MYVESLHPAGIALELRGTSHHAPLLGRAHLGRILADFHLNASETAHFKEQIADAALYARGNDIGFARPAARQQSSISGDDIAHVTEIARRIDIPRLNHRGLPSLGNGDYLPGKRRKHETTSLASAYVIERARDHYVELLASMPLHAELLSSPFTDGIRAARFRQKGLIDRESAIGNASVNITGADVQKASGEAFPRKRLKQMQGPNQVDLQRLIRVVERLGYETLCSKVDYRVRTRIAQRTFDCSHIAQISTGWQWHSLDMTELPLRHRVQQMLSDEPTGTRHKKLFRPIIHAELPHDGQRSRNRERRAYEQADY